MKPFRSVLRALLIAALVLSFLSSAAGRAWADDPVPVDTSAVPAPDNPVGGDVPPPVDISPDDPEFE